ncbi:TetR/AcrR family transcriptional regulator [Actinocorallia populi]|uniref:TetR/AcrR family transcriptional regulator n=1 Tax=Actinocorallia populi TaxID=2079200 RepID=UPI0013007204|nr:TetR/AcrR family transcriptional regulator [Actinocorallia populi]
MGSTTRPYRGRTAEERRAERRARLLAAALELWGDQGWAAVTMRGVCAHAGLNDRYFYESFADVEQLLLAVYDQALRDLLGYVERVVATAPTPRERIRTGMAVFVHAMASDSRRARIGLAEPAGSPALEQRRRDTYHLFARLARDWLRPADEEAFTVAVLFALGGVGELIINWLGGTLALTPDELADRASGLVLGVIAPYL